MASLLDKINTLISANLHAMVDKALQSNSVAVMDEYIRQAEDNLDKLEDATATVGGEVKTLQRKAEQYQQQYERQQAEYKTLLEAKLKLEAKLTTTKQEREEMLALLDLAKSKELTVQTMKSIDDIVGSGDADVARLGESIRGRLDKASARSEMMASRLDDQIDEALGKTELDSQLAERKKRLGMSS